MFLIGGLPAHPLVVHAVVVLLPLAALGAIAVAARPAWRRSLGIPVLLIGLVGVFAVPVATRTGGQLEEAVGHGNPLIQIHEGRADLLLPWALLFGVFLLATVLVGRYADRAAGVTAGAGSAAGGADASGAPSGRPEPAGGAARLTLVTRLTGVAAALLGIVVAGLVVWIGDAGATATWSGVGGGG
ncbi:MAG TPA: DUF2231 domain-containing protein [Pseudonocardia sp.]|jgi:hypothetical protein